MLSISKKVLFVLSLPLMFLCGCDTGTESSRFTGQWRASLVDGGKSVLVGLKLRQKDNRYQGTFSVLSETTRGADVKKGFTIEIVNIQISGNQISFLVPLNNGKIDRDSLVFNLMVADNQLTGTLKENRNSSKVANVTFSRR